MKRTSRVLLFTFYDESLELLIEYNHEALHCHRRHVVIVFVHADFETEILVRYFVGVSEH